MTASGDMVATRSGVRSFAEMSTPKPESLSLTRVSLDVEGFWCRGEGEGEGEGERDGDEVGEGGAEEYECRWSTYAVVMSVKG